MTAAPIDWSQLWFPGPRRRFSAQEMARAGTELPSTTFKAVLLANVAFLGFAVLQFAPTRHLPVLAAALVAAALFGWAAARWLWWRPWRGPLMAASAGLTVVLVTIALAIRWRVPDRELHYWLAGSLIAWSLLGCLGLWFLAVWRSDRIAARLAELNERERTAELSRRLLAAQVQPHFVFNTLAALQHWVDTSDARASPLLAAFTAYLRSTLPMFDRTRLTLAEEAQAARRYLEVMQLRLGERLAWSVDVAPAAEAAMLPPGLLLTLVENAVAHGVEPQLRGGRVTVVAQCEGDRLALTVRDDGPGPAGMPMDGTGLANLRARLALAYGTAARFALEAPPEGGAMARMELPVQTQPLP